MPPARSSVTVLGLVGRALGLSPGETRALPIHRRGRRVDGAELYSSRLMPCLRILSSAHGYDARVGLRAGLGSQICLNSPRDRHAQTAGQVGTAAPTPAPRQNHEASCTPGVGKGCPRTSPITRNHDAPREPPGVRGRPGPALLVSGTINKRWRDNKARASSPEGMHFEEGPAFNSNHEGLPRFRSGRGLCRKS